MKNDNRMPSKKSLKDIRSEISEDSIEEIGELNHEKFGPMLDGFVQFASKKLGIKSLPQMELTKQEMTTSFGGYQPDKQSIAVVSKNRHPMDVFRTVAHELVHHKQKEDGRLGKDISKEGATGSDIENEANSEAGKLMRWYAKANPEMFKSGYVTEEALVEGINDPGTFKAVFLGGGPGSGKDFVMKQTLAGNGLQEINSDLAFEFLMRKAGLNFKMPESEREPRDKVRGLGKNITKEQQRLALAGRRGLIINGTGDDPAKIAAIKKELEGLGYETMMVFVNTSDKVSKERNIQRGEGGGRAVPEDIRKEKWDACQEAIPSLEKLFGKDNFVKIDNSADLRTAPKSVKDRVQGEFQKIFKMARKFIARQPNENPAASKWTQSEMQKRNMQSFVPASSAAYGSSRGAIQVSTALPPDQDNTQQVSQAPTADEMSQAKRLGLTYYGFGRYGSTIKGKHTVTYIGQNGKLVPKPQQVAEDLRDWFNPKHPEGGWKRINSKGEAIGPCAREPGEPKPKCMSNKKRASLTPKERASAVRSKRRSDPNPERSGKPINVSNFGKGRISEDCWDGYRSKGMKKKGNKMVPDCVPEKDYLEEKNIPTSPELWSRAKSMARQKFDVYPSAYANGWASKWYKSKGGGWKTQADESFERMVSENTPSDREWGKPSLTKIYSDATPGQSFPSNPLFEKIRAKKGKKKLAQEDNIPAMGYEFGNSGLGDTFGVVRSPTGLGYGYSLPMSESAIAWSNKEETIDRFIAKYGQDAERKLYEAAQKLSQLDVGNIGPKYFTSLRESWDAVGGRDMGTVSKQGSKEEVVEDQRSKELTNIMNWKRTGNYPKDDPTTWGTPDSTYYVRHTDKTKPRPTPDELYNQIKTNVERNADKTPPTKKEIEGLEKELLAKNPPKGPNPTLDDLLKKYPPKEVPTVTPPTTFITPEEREKAAERGKASAEARIKELELKKPTPKAAPPAPAPKAALPNEPKWSTTKQSTWDIPPQSDKPASVEIVPMSAADQNKMFGPMPGQPSAPAAEPKVQPPKAGSPASGNKKPYVPITAKTIAAPVSGGRSLVDRQRSAEQPKDITGAEGSLQQPSDTNADIVSGGRRATMNMTPDDAAKAKTNVFKSDNPAPTDDNSPDDNSPRELTINKATKSGVDVLRSRMLRKIENLGLDEESAASRFFKNTASSADAGLKAASDYVRGTASSAGSSIKNAASTAGDSIKNAATSFGNSLIAARERRIAKAGNSVNTKPPATGKSPYGNLDVPGIKKSIQSDNDELDEPKKPDVNVKSAPAPAPEKTSNRHTFASRINGSIQARDANDERKSSDQNQDVDYVNRKTDLGARRAEWDNLVKNSNDKKKNTPMYQYATKGSTPDDILAGSRYQGGAGLDEETDDKPVDLSKKREEKQLQTFHKGFMGDLRDRVDQHAERIQNHIDSGKFTMRVGDRFSTEHSRNRNLPPSKITGYYVNSKNPDGDYGYHIETPTEDGVEQSMMSLRHPGSEKRLGPKRWAEIQAGVQKYEPLRSIKESWQDAKHKNPKGGLKQSGVEAYRRENPGSKLQTAVTTKPSKLKPGSKAAQRRKNFCARMGGMPGPMKDEKGRPTRKTLSLRRWNCRIR